MFDLSRAPGSRVVEILARCVKCRVPTMLPLQQSESYEIAMPTFLANGGDGFAVIRDNKIQHHLTGVYNLHPPAGVCIYKTVTGLFADGQFAKIIPPKVRLG